MAEDGGDLCRVVDAVRPLAPRPLLARALELALLLRIIHEVLVVRVVISIIHGFKVLGGGLRTVGGFGRNRVLRMFFASTGVSAAFVRFANGVGDSMALPAGSGLNGARSSVQIGVVATSGRAGGCVGARELGMQRAAPWGRVYCQKQLGASVRCQQAEKPLATSARRCLRRRGKYELGCV